ncbi:MAG: hypothetical protein EOM19_07785 [Candidatus Moranbacteria bacterium]|nr:hypothetical protein [Candidatus Moranbacteria bacterium]
MEIYKEKSIFLDVPYFKQDVLYSCGPVCVQMILSYFGRRVGERDLMESMKTNTQIGTTPGNMLRIVRKYGLFSYVNNTSSLREIRHFLSIGLPVIVYFVEPITDDDHYAVVTGFRGNTIIFNDPLNGKNFSLSLSDFEKCWHGKKKYHTLLRSWILVASPETFSLGRQYQPLKEIL